MKINFKAVLLSAASVAFFSGCSNTEDACEDVTLASEQVQECQSLQRKISRAKNEPLIRSELERRFQQDCVDIRYYRDDHQIAICDNKEKIEKVREEAIKEGNLK